MERTLSEHIASLEQKIETLKKHFLEPGRSEIEKSEMLIDLNVAERALICFRKAFELEQKVHA